MLGYGIDVSLLWFWISDQAALETEARISPLLYEKKKLFNDLLTAKGNHLCYVFVNLVPFFFSA